MLNKTIMKNSEILPQSLNVASNAMQTIDIQAKEYFDKTNANSYFSARVTLDFGLPTERTVYVPFQYGYGTQFIDTSIDYLQKMELLPNDRYLGFRYFDENNINLRTSKHFNCTQKTVKDWGKN